MLNSGFGDKEIKIILTCVKKHNHSSPSEPEILEEMVVFDADKSDSYGDIGASRWFLVQGRKGKHITQATLEGVNYINLAMGRKLFYTETAK